MIGNKKVFYTITFVITIIVVFIIDDFIRSGALALTSTVLGYIIYYAIHGKNKMDLIEEKCDPILFLEVTENERKQIGENLNYNL